MSERRRTRGRSGAEPGRVRALWLIKGLGPGGAEQQLVELARHAQGRTLDAQAIYVLSRKDRLAPSLVEAGVPTRSLGVSRLSDLRWLWRLRPAIRDADVDIVHSHSPLVAVAARLVVRTIRSRPAVISTEHNVWQARRWPTRIANALTFGLDDLHIAVSQRVRDSFPRPLRRSAVVIDHGVDTAAIAPMSERRGATRSALGLRDDQIVLCTIANFRWQKGYPELLGGIRSVIDTGRDVRLLIIGQGPLESEVVSLCEELDLLGHVTLLGHRFDAVEILAASDVFVLASRHEGYPIVVLEALAAGVPIVSTDVGAVPSVVTEGREGRIVPVGDSAALAQAVIELVDDPELRMRMSACARERSRAFDITASVARLLDVYRAVAQRRDRGPRHRSG